MWICKLVWYCVGELYIRYGTMIQYVFCLRIRRPPRSTRTTQSFPTRRSSDLLHVRGVGFEPRQDADRVARTAHTPARSCPQRRYSQQTHRSEEHTSELQSLMRSSYAVFCSTRQRL